MASYVDNTNVFLKKTGITTCGPGNNGLEIAMEIIYQIKNANEIPTNNKMNLYHLLFVKSCSVCFFIKSII